MQQPVGLFKGLSGLREMTQRRRLLQERMLALNTAEQAKTLQQVIDAARQPDRGLYIDFICSLLFDPGLGYEASRQLYEVMVDMGFHREGAILLEGVHGPAGVEFPFYELDDVPLGMRKAKARSGDRNVLDMLCYDHSPDVIEILLKNPILTIDKVLKIASMRPQRSEVLYRVLANSRWAYRQKVVTALVMNPWTPTGMAAGLTPILGVSDLKQVSEDRTLHGLVRDFARITLSSLS